MRTRQHPTHTKYFSTIVAQLFFALLSAPGCLFLSSCSFPGATGAAHPSTSRPGILSSAEIERAKAAILSESPTLESKEIKGTAQLVTSIPFAGLLALQHNPSFQVERLRPDIQETYERSERAAFDPTLTAEARMKQEGTGKESEAASVMTDLSTHDTTRTGTLGMKQLLPTGTTISLSTGRTLDDSFGDQKRKADYLDTEATTTSSLTVTQSLLRGFGPAVNLARLRQAGLDTRISRYLLEGAAQTTLYQTERAGWDYLLARRQIEIYEESHTLAQNQLTEVKERIRVGSMADVELAAFEAEVADRREALINARSALSRTRLEFLRLVDQNGEDHWTRELVLTDTPEVPTEVLSPIEEHIALALRKNPALNEARLRIDRGELEVVRTRNGLLPKLDFFVALGDSRYSSSFASTDKGSNSDTQSVEAGLKLEVALGQRGEQAIHDRSLFTLEQLREAMRNQESLTRLDISTTYLEVQRTGEQIEATRATHKFREQSLRAETEKFRVGKSTGLLVAQAQRDLVASQISEIDAVIQHLKARLTLYRQEGSLLERRGILLEAP